MSVFYDIVKQAEGLPNSDKDIFPFMNLYYSLSREMQDEYIRGSDLYERLSNGAPVWSPYIAEYDDQIEAMLAAR